MNILFWAFFAASNIPQTTTQTTFFISSTLSDPVFSMPPAEPSGRDFPGDEFANNLFSDLAPLLTLFGEKVTKQFLSMSMGWADNVLLATGPLGILTVVVSAIRGRGRPAAEGSGGKVCAWSLSPEMVNADCQKGLGKAGLRRSRNSCPLRRRTYANFGAARRLFVRLGVRRA